MLRIKSDRYSLILFFIVIAGAVMRLMALTTNSMWWDELQSMRTADPANSFSEINAICDSSYDPAPRSFYFLLNLWFRLVGFNDLTGRLFVALFGIASIPVMYQLGKQLISREAGLVAAAITAFNYYTIFYSLEVRFYPVLFFLSALSYLFFIRSLRTPDLRNLSGYVISTVLLLVTHYFALLVFMSQGITWLVINRKSLLSDKRRHRAFFVSFLLVMFLYLPFLHGLIQTLKTKSAGLSFSEGDYFFVEYFNAYFGRNSMSVFVALIAFMFFVVSAFNNTLVSKNDDLKKQEGFLVLCWLMLPVAIAYVRTIMGTPTIAERYCIVIVPALILAVSYGFLSVKNTTLKISLLILFLSGSFINTVLSKELYTKTTKDDFKGVVKAIQAGQSGDHFQIYSDKNWHFMYYYKQFGIRPICLDREGLADARFFTGPVYPVDSLLKNASIKDFWVTSAHFTNLQAMKQTSEQINASALYLKIDSFAGTDAFADHYIRKDWIKWPSTYPFRNVISVDQKKWILKPGQLVSENGSNAIAVWDGEIGSQPIQLKKGSYKLFIRSRGTPARDSFPNLDVLVNNRKIGQVICTNDYTEADLKFDVAGADSIIQLKLRMTNDLYDKKSNADRNVFINRVIIKSN